MDPFSLIICLVIIITICLQVCQLFDFSETRSQVIEAFYLGVIIALLLTSDFLKFL